MFRSLCTIWLVAVLALGVQACVHGSNYPTLKPKPAPAGVLTDSVDGTNDVRIRSPFAELRDIVD